MGFFSLLHHELGGDERHYDLDGGKRRGHLTVGGVDDGTGNWLVALEELSSLEIRPIGQYVYSALPTSYLVTPTGSLYPGKPNSSKWCR
jgi:hypothetical protein